MAKKGPGRTGFREYRGYYSVPETTFSNELNSIREDLNHNLEKAKVDIENLMKLYNRQDIPENTRMETEAILSRVMGLYEMLRSMQSGMIQ